MTAEEYNRSIKLHPDAVGDTNQMFMPGQALENNPEKGLLSGAKRSKSKRNPKGGSLLKAYFPNLISNKDPTKAKGSDLHP